MRNNLRYLYFVICLSVLNSCFPDSKQAPDREFVVDSIATKAPTMSDCDTLPTINFKRHWIVDSSDLASIRSTYNFDDGYSAAHKTIVTLNRKEFRFFRIGDTIIIPERISEKITDYSIFPPCYPAAKDIPKIIFVSNKYQAYACYENGKLVRFAAANTGKERSQTYPGRYSINWKKQLHHSSLDSNWVMPFTMNFHMEAGNAFHQFTMPGRPVSHSCIRQFRSDAQWLYDWAVRARWDTSGIKTREGTTVIILDAFDFSRKKFGPWLDLASNKSTTIALPDDPMNYEEALIPISQIPHGARGQLKNIERYINAEQTLRERGVIRPQVVLVETKNFNVLRRKREKEKMKLADSTNQLQN